MQETQVQSLGLKDPVEKERATNSNILAGRIPWSLAGYSPQGCKELDMTEHAHMQEFHSHTFTVFSRPKGTQVVAIGYLMFTKKGEKGII